VDQQMAQLSSQLSSLKASLERRTVILEKLVRFFKLYGQLDKEMGHLERQLLTGPAGAGDSFRNNFEESRLLIQQLYLQV
jgi:hypothetical protein